MSFFGATVKQVIQSLHGADTGNVVDTGAYGTDPEIEEIMGGIQSRIIAKLPPDAQSILLYGKIVCHKVIDETQNTAQTAVDFAQDFIGTVDTLTFRLSQNEKLGITDEGLDSSEWDITTNVLTISASKSRGDTFYAYYNLNPSTIVLKQLARILIDHCTIVLGRREVFGGSGGEDDDIVEMAELLTTEINEYMASFQEDTAVSGLLEMNLCTKINSPNVGTVMDNCRG